ncbi:hypothetical protein PIROE2DRAFT_58462 [Piromyces sp. E2]|nr:hypothetical protein PIROE2DRAFT_58462 [Piromyces sp. E2]|eukprot:OUM67863.1 hypothetical protein PIROE2DRAFT_58462 [Piromyces sp. E2]
MAFLTRKKTLIKYLIVLILIIFAITLTSKLTSSENQYNPVIQKHLKNAFGNSTPKEEILYISRYQDAVNNMKYIMDKLGYEVYNLVPWYAPNKRPECFDNRACSTMFTAICRKYKYIIVNDIVSDGYGYINSACSSKIIFELNNRYDVYIPQEEKEEFNVKFGTSLVNEKKDISIVLQNSYENYYACKKGIYIPYYYNIGTTGYYNELSYDIIQSVEKEDIIAVVEETSQDSLIAKVELLKRDVPVEIVPWKNCNPRTLAKYKAQLILPSHVTSRKIMENFKHGIVMMIPSEAFFREMVRETNQYSFDSPNIIKMDEGLEKYTDWYNDDMEDLFVFFNSWDDIRGLLHSVNFDKVRTKAKEFADKQELKVIEQWREIMSEKPSNKYIIHKKKPICKSNEGHFYNYSNN